jgi:hypothetical protein
MSDSAERIRGQIRDQIRVLEQKIDGAQQELESAPGPEKENLVALILRSRAEIDQKQTDLKESQAALDPPLTDPRVFGSEITQGLVEYELVAGKDTLARVFLGYQKPRVQLFAAAEIGGVSLPAGFHFDEPWGGVSRLDYASLEVTHIPTGVRFEVPATMSGEFSTPGRSEDDNVNFYIDGRSLWRQGDYGFVARFYRDGSLVGTNSLGNRRFLKPAELRLLIKVNRDPPTDAAWDTLLRSLEFVQRNLPVRAGVAPMDSDLSAGLRFFIDPVPYDTGWGDAKKWAPAYAALDAFNAQQEQLGLPDRADQLLNWRMQRPGEMVVGGQADGPTAEGWRGGPGVVSGVQLQVFPPGDDFFASVISQELGHNLIPTGGVNAHDPDRALASDTPFDLLNRRSLAEAHSIMFNPVGTPSELRLFSPDHWSKIRRRLLERPWFPPEE